jgi:general secretion pathway protein A
MVHMPTTPYTTSPNPALLYLTPSLKATLAKVRFVLDYRQGLTALLGDPGMGKSSLVRRLYLEYSLRDDCAAALIPSPNYPSDFGLLKGICGELKVPPKRSMVDQESALRDFLFECVEHGKNCVVFIDEAQRLSRNMLEIVRTLLNLETNEEKLIQVVLSGQLELRDRLKEPRSKALRSRIMTPSLLDPLAPEETAEMIAFRSEAGNVPNLFTSDAVKAIYTASGGVPRIVLAICAVAWTVAQAEELDRITPDIIDIALSADPLRDEVEVGV